MGGLGGSERRGVEVDAGAALGGMEAEAGGGVGVVGDFSAAIGFNDGVGFAGGDDGDAAGGEQRAETDAEGEGEGFFGLSGARWIGEVATDVVAAVGCIEEDYEAGSLGVGGDGERDCNEECEYSHPNREKTALRMGHPVFQLRRRSRTHRDGAAMRIRHPV
jgi:hypothetical protein